MAITVLQWSAYFVPMSALGVGFTYWLLTLVPTAAAREMRKHAAPPGVTVDPVSAQAIHDELDRRMRAGAYAGGAVYCLVVAALHPMYAPERLTDAVGGMAWFICLAAGFVIGETYVATRAAAAGRPARRVATLTPRNAREYLSTSQRILQAGLLAGTLVGAVALTLVVIATEEPAWTVPAMYGGWVWFAGNSIVLAAQRHVLARPSPIDGDRTALVREFVTANAMQLLHRTTWLLGLFVYTTATTYAVGSTDLTPMLIEMAPVAAIALAAYWLPRLLHRPDPFWHFARAGSLA